MFAIIAALLLFAADEAETVANLLNKANPANSKAVRLQALKKLQDVKPNDPKSACKILEQFLKDSDSEIRSEAMVTLTTLALQANLECPVSLVKAIHDKDPNIADLAGDLAVLFEKVPESELPEIAKAATSENWELRETAAGLLAGSIGRSPEALRILKPLLDDPNEFVRYRAHLSHFRTTDDFSVHVTYFLEYNSDLNIDPPAKTAEQKRNRERRNLTRLMVARAFYQFAMDRPKKLAKELIANLSHKDPRVRQSALLQIRAMCISSQETYQAVPKEKAQAAIENLFDDNNEKVRSWAYLAYSHVKDGPPPDAPKKLRPLESSIDGTPETATENEE